MPFLPSPWDQAMETFEWKKDQPINLELHPDMALIHADDTQDSKHRLEMSRRLGMTNRRAWGYVVNIDKTNSENTRTPFEVQILTRVVYLLPGESQWSYVWARVTAHTSNMLITNFDTLPSERVEIRYKNPPGINFDPLPSEAKQPSLEKG